MTLVQIQAQIKYKSFMLEKQTGFMYPMIMQVIVSQIAHSQWCITIGHVGGAVSNISSPDSEL